MNNGATSSNMCLQELLGQSCGKLVKLCLGDNTFIQGTISVTQKDFVIIQREPVTFIPLDKIIWLQFLD